MFNQKSAYSSGSIRHVSQNHWIIDREAAWLAMCRTAVFSPPLKGAVQRAVTVHHDETEPLVVLEQLVQRLEEEHNGES